MKIESKYAPDDADLVPSMSCLTSKLKVEYPRYANVAKSGRKIKIGLALFVQGWLVVRYTTINTFNSEALTAFSKCVDGLGGRAFLPTK